MGSGSDTAGTLHMVYKLDPEQLSDRWVVKSEQFKSFAYGKTRDEAVRNFRKIVEMAVQRFTDGEALAHYLDTTGIHWWFEQPEEDMAHQELGVSLLVV